MTPCSCSSAIRPASLGLTLRPSICLSRFRIATAIAVSHNLGHGSDDAAKKARASLPKILSPIGLSRRLPAGRQPPARALVVNALGLKQQSLPEPFVAMTMNLSSRSRLRKSSISGVRCRRDSSKSSATRMSSRVDSPCFAWMCSSENEEPQHNPRRNRPFVNGPEIAGALLQVGGSSPQLLTRPTASRDPAPRKTPEWTSVPPKVRIAIASGQRRRARDGLTEGRARSGRGRANRPARRRTERGAILRLPLIGTILSLVATSLPLRRALGGGLSSG